MKSRCVSLRGDTLTTRGERLDRDLGERFEFEPLCSKPQHPRCSVDDYRYGFKLKDDFTSSEDCVRRC